MTDQEVIKEEIDAILSDILTVYEQSGRKASGQFAEGLEAIYSPYQATIRGYVYLAGRGKTKKKGKAGEPTLQQSILKWLQVKGIKAIERNISQKSLAFLIARKIHEEGTNPSEWLRIYEQVITPERIDRIIDRVSQLNVNRIITQINAELEILAKNV
ncbi:MAG: hypothetical protein PVG07_00150 [Acidobacteriota bacterium]|jgi:hypothetical protein